MSLDDPAEYSKLADETRTALAAWIRRRLASNRNRLKHRTSYGLKHEFEGNSGIYVTNGAFKGAMLACGFQVVDDTARNWEFR
jgi:hypothetical protein